MSNLKQKLMKIINIELTHFYLKEKKLSVSEFADEVLRIIHENPSIKQGLKLLKEKREQDKWRREIKK